MHFIYDFYTLAICISDLNLAHLEPFSVLISSFSVGCVLDDLLQIWWFFHSFLLHWEP